MGVATFLPVGQRAAFNRPIDRWAKEAGAQRRKGSEMIRPLVALMALVLLLLPGARANAAGKPWPIQVVIMVTYEVGADTGDVPGEFQAWAERDNLTETLPFPGGVHPILTNKEHTILGVVSGTTLVNAAASTMALGLDPRFDLTRAYWLVNGTAGVDPKAASVGSAAWAKFAVGDISRYIDPREAPPAWPYGNFAMGAKEPNQPPPPNQAINDRPNVYPLNDGLVNWAYNKTKDVALDDTPAVAAFRADFVDDPNARRKPFVLIGDSYSGDTFWHGTLMTRYAEDWVRIFTGGKGTFVMTDMEDPGFAEAIVRLDRLHRVDAQRLLILRVGSNYCMPRPGHTAVESLTAPYIGGRLAFENTWRVGEPIVRELTAHWNLYADHIPGN
jgi:purine nucleoside permease